MSNELVSTEHLLFCEFVKKKETSLTQKMWVCAIFSFHFLLFLFNLDELGKENEGKRCAQFFLHKGYPTLF